MAIFGNPNSYSSYSGIGNYGLLSCRFQLTENGTVTTISANLISQAGDLPAKVAIYDDLNGEPHALKGFSSEVTINAAAWYDFPVNIALSAGWYWLTVFLSSEAIRLAYSTTDIGEMAYTYLAYGNFPDLYDTSHNNSAFLSSIYATYTPTIQVTHTLTLNSTPIQGISITAAGVSNLTPWSEVLNEGSYAVSAPQSIVVGTNTYNFKNWEDGSTSRTRTINLLSDLALTATYELAPVTPTYHTLTINSTPITGIPFNRI